MRREWTYTEQVFSDAECEELIERGMQRTLKAGTVYGKPGARPQVRTRSRRAQVAFIQRGERDFADVFERVDDCVDVANDDFFGVRYNRRLRQIQFTVYEGGEHGAKSYYRVHSDTSLLTAGRPTQRKLSAVLQLSPPEDYTGGDLRLVDVVDPPPAEPMRRRGTLVVFPSLLRHEVTSVTAGTRISLVGWYQGEPWR